MMLYTVYVKSLMALRVGGNHPDLSMLCIMWPIIIGSMIINCIIVHGRIKQ